MHLHRHINQVPRPNSFQRIWISKKVVLSELETSISYRDSTKLWQLMLCCIKFVLMQSDYVNSAELYIVYFFTFLYQKYTQTLFNPSYVYFLNRLLNIILYGSSLTYVLWYCTKRLHLNSSPISKIILKYILCMLDAFLIIYNQARRLLNIWLSSC